jgi:Spy/CpxP family protein refolding chaperone
VNILKRFNHMLVFLLIIGLLLLSVHIISAQQGARQGRQQQGARQGRQFDPAQMMTRMLERAVEGLNLSEEEATIIKPKIESLLQARFDQNSEVRELTTGLQEAVDAKDNDQIVARLTALKKKLKENREKLEKMENELIELLTPEQEARLTLSGTVNSGGGIGGFGGFRAQRGQRNRPGGAPGEPGAQRPQ